MYHLIQTKVQLIIASVLLCATLLLPAAAHAQGFISNSTYIGGNRTENKSYFTKGDNSESYLLGASDSTGGNTSASGNTYPITLGVPTLAVQSMVLTKLDANTNIVWSRFVGGSKSDSPTDIKYANGFVYIIGNTQSADYPVTNGTTLATGYKTPFYTKLDATTGQIVFSTYLIGNSYSRGIQVVNGGVYITSQLANASGNYDDIRVTKYDAATDALLFNVTYGGTNQDNYAAGSEAFAVAGNDVYIVGSTYSTDFPVTNGSTLRASNNMTYLKLNATTRSEERRGGKEC